MDLYPAIDVRDGRAVRLLRGDFDQETVYGDDPVGVAQGFATAGAPWVHVVDLDAARTGRPENRDVVVAIAGVVRARGGRVQSGGGVRDETAAEALLQAGVDRVVIGTAALEDPALVRRLASAFPGHVAVGLDVRGREVAVRGWTEGSGIDLMTVVPTFEEAGAAALIVTQIRVDGTLEGPDLGGLCEVLEATSMPVIASGGVGRIDDLRALATLEAGGRRLAGAIVGRALYEGTLDLSEALAALRAVR